MNRTKPIVRILFASGLLAAFALMPALVGATIEVTNNNDSGPGSLREALGTAAGSDTITVATDSTIALTTGQLYTNSANVTISGTGVGAPPVIDGGGTSRILSVAAGSTIRFENIELARGTIANSAGGAIDNAGQITGTNVAFTENTTAYGGAIYNGGVITLDDASFTGNRSIQDAGAIHNNGGQLNLSNAAFVSNTSEGTYGGAIFNNNGAVVLENVLFDQNASSVEGGAIANYSANASLMITGGTFSNNYAGNVGGALGNRNGSTVLRDVVFTSNTAGVGGGAIFQNSTDAAITLVASNWAEITHTGNVALNGGSTPDAAAGGFMYIAANALFVIGDGGRMTIGTAGEADGAIDSIAGDPYTQIVKEGNGTLVINSDASHYAGNIVINAGQISLGREDTFSGIGALNLLAPGATLDLQANQTFNGWFNSNAGTYLQLNSYNFTLASASDTTFAGTVFGYGTFIKEGDTTLTLIGSQAIANNTLLNSGVIKFTEMDGGYTGPIKSIQIAGADAWLDLSDAGAGYDPDGSTANVWSGLYITGNAGHIIGADDQINLGSGTHGFDIGAPGQEGVFVVINAPGGIATLTGSNSYVGYTRINAGTLLLTGSHQLGSETGIVREVILNGGDLAIAADYSNTARSIEQRMSGAIDVAAQYSSTWNNFSGTSTATVYKSGNGTLAFVGNFTAGTAYVLSGALNVAGSTVTDALAISGPATANLNGGSLGTVDVYGTLNLSGTTTVAAGTLVGVINNTGTTTINGNLAGTGTMNNIGVLAAKNLEGTLMNSGTATVGNVTTQVINTGRITLAAPGTTNFGNLSGVNGVVNFFDRANGTAGDHLVIYSNLSGSQTFGNVKVNFSDPSKTNTIDVWATATGTHTLQLVRDTSGTVSDLHGAPQTIVSTIAGDATFSANAIDDGMFSYALQKGDRSDATPDIHKWYLTPTTPSSAAGVILTAAGALGTDWHYSLDSLYLRMGELRAGPIATTGNIWVRGNAYQLNAGHTVAGSPFDQKTYSITGGIDKAFQFASGTWLFGGFVQMGDSDRDHDYDNSSDTSSLGAGIYATYLFGDGWFFDGVAKYDRYKNSLNARGADGFETTADYDSAAQGLSVEFGKRITLQRYWIEPSVQAAVAWLDGAGYDASNGLHVRVESATAWQYRGQVRAGATYGKWMPYVKVGAVLSDTDGGEVRTQGYTFQTDFDGVRVETGVGTAYFITNNSQVYLDYEYGRADQYERPWSINLGYRCVW